MAAKLRYAQVVYNSEVQIPKMNRLTQICYTYHGYLL